MLGSGWAGCNRKAYICPAYQSVFQLDMAAYKRNQAMDSLALAADTSLDIDVIAVLAERIRKNQDADQSLDADSTPQFTTPSVVKNEFLIIKSISRKRKNKLLASVPMVTVFPASSTDSASASAAAGADGAPAPDTTPLDAPANELNNAAPAPQPADTPADAPAVPPADAPAAPPTEPPTQPQKRS